MQDIIPHLFPICEGVTIEDEVFIGHGVMFINDRYPEATTDGQPQTEADWVVTLGGDPGTGKKRCLYRHRCSDHVRSNYRRKGYGRCRFCCDP